MDCQFRNAAFGGFNRQDVMEYLERTDREHSQAVQELQGKLDAAGRERDDLAVRLEEAETRIRVLTQESESCRREAEQERSGRAAAEEREQVQSGRLKLLEAEADELRRRVARLEPDAQAYAAVKERAAGVELEAHRRAQGILDQAEEQAHALRQQMEQWLGRVSREYEDLCSQVDATVSHAAGELDKVRQSLDHISQCMDRQDGALDGLMRAYSETDQTRVPAPMPLNETD